MRAVDVDAAVETFARGYAFTRSITHPYLAERTGEYWRLHDAPRTTGKIRNEEWIGYAADPDSLTAAAAAGSSGRYFITTITPIERSTDDVRSAYRSLGCRLLGTERFMVHRLRTIPRPQSPARIVRVRTAVQLRELTRATRRRHLLDEHLREDSPVVQYAAMIDNVIIGRAQSIMVGRMAWCADVFVVPGHRRRGVASCLLTRMLRDERKRGAVASVLQASKAGGPLYLGLGYQDIATSLLVAPLRQPGKPTTATMPT